MNKPTPTQKQKETWDMFDKLTLENKIPPSARELMQALGMSSTSTITSRLKCGVRVGRLVGLPGPMGTYYAPAWWWTMVVENLEKYHDKKEKFG